MKYITPTYTKPLVVEKDGRRHELERQDIKNRGPLPAGIQEEIITRLRNLLPAMDGVAVADQVIENDCGVITGQVRAEIKRLAKQNPEMVIAVDSRARIGQYESVILKPNAQEALATLPPAAAADSWSDRLQACGLQLYHRTGKPVFLTMGDQGILVVTGSGCERVPAVAVGGEIDIVGAGDSCLAGLVAALACGAQPAEAAFIGNLVASITIQQIGTTGTASREQVRTQFWQHFRNSAPPDLAR